MISIGEDVEAVLQNRQEISLEEAVRRVGTSRNDVVDELDSDAVEE